MSGYDPKDDAQARLRNLCELYGLDEGGVYAHWKGGYYVIKALSIHEETLEPLVTYKSNLKWTNSTRNLEVFIQEVDWPGPSITVRRFERVDR